MNIKLRAAIYALGTLVALSFAVIAGFAAFTYIDPELIVLLGAGAMIGMMTGMLYTMHLERLRDTKISEIITRTLSK